MLFVEVMMKRSIYSFIVFAAFLFSLCMLSCSKEDNTELSETVKIALRNVGHQLLLGNQDSTSLVLPVVALEKSKYKLSFQNQLAFEPNSLVNIVKSSFEKANLSEYYRVEVIECTNKEVAYSYKMSAEDERTIISCSSRILSEDCYIIEVKFTHVAVSFFNENTFVVILIFMISILLIFHSYRKKQKRFTEVSNTNYAKIGSFQFYPDQNKLIKESEEISLSKKECELLEIFVANPNQIVKRDELTKKVWEDNGVFVGRSLDTYISKLRKKLKTDSSIKLTNVHGVGYKLEVNL